MHYINLKLNIKIIEVFASEIAKKPGLETGGVLLGFVEDNSLNITHASGPGQKAIHEEYYFRADPDYIDMYIDMALADSKIGTIYLGEWHTHPQVEPIPSEVDLNSLSEIVDSSQKTNVLLILSHQGFKIDKFAQQSIGVVKSYGCDAFFQLPIRLLI